jgi:hypothetical protein
MHAYFFGNSNAPLVAGTGRGGVPTSPQQLSVSLVDLTWLCTSAVKLDSVTVTIHAGVGKEGRPPRPRLHQLDRLHYGHAVLRRRDQCQRRRNLVVGAGMIRCYGREPGKRTSG